MTLMELTPRQLEKHLENPMTPSALEQRMSAHADLANNDPEGASVISSVMVPYVEAELADARWSDAHALLRKHLTVYRSWLR